MKTFARLLQTEMIAWLLKDVTFVWLKVQENVLLKHQTGNNMANYIKCVLELTSSI